MLDEYSVFYNQNVNGALAAGMSVSQIREQAMTQANAALAQGKSQQEVFSALDNWGLRPMDTPDDIAHAKKLTNLMFVNQKTGKAMPNTAPEREITPGMGLLETMGAGASGRSVLGLANKVVTGDKESAILGESSTFSQKVAYGAGQFMGDILPMSLAAKVLSPMLGTGPVGWAGYAASLAAVGLLTGGARQFLMDWMRLGKVEDIGEAMSKFIGIADTNMDASNEKVQLEEKDYQALWEMGDRIKRAGKSGLSEALVFGATGGAAAGLQKALFSNLPKLLEGMTPVQQFYTLAGRGSAAFGGEIAAMTGAQGAVAATKAIGSDNYWQELKAALPTLSDVMVNAVTVGGFKAAGMTANRIGEYYVDHGLTPQGFRSLVMDKQGFAYEALADSWQGNRPRGRLGYRATGDERVYYDRNMATAVSDERIAAATAQRSTALAEEKSLLSQVKTLETELVEAKTAKATDRIETLENTLTGLKTKLNDTKQLISGLNSAVPDSNGSTPARGIESVLVPNTRVIDVPFESEVIADIIVGKFIKETGVEGVPADKASRYAYENDILRNPTPEFKNFLKNTSWKLEEVRALLGKNADKYNLDNVVRNPDGTLDWSWRGLTYGDTFLPLKGNDVIPMKVVQSIKGLSDVAKVELQKLTEQMKGAAKDAGSNLTDADIRHNAAVLRGMALSAQQLFGIDAEVFLSKYKFTGQTAPTLEQLNKKPGVFKQVEGAYERVPWLTEKLDLVAEMQKNGLDATAIEKKTGFSIDKSGDVVIREPINTKSIDASKLKAMKPGNKMYLYELYDNPKLYDTIPDLLWKQVDGGITPEILARDISKAVADVQGRSTAQDGYIEYLPKYWATEGPTRPFMQDSFWQGEKGLIDVRNGNRWITLFQKADSSTVIHEFGHAFVADLFRRQVGGDVKAGADITLLRKAAGMRKLDKNSYEKLQNFVVDKLWEPYFMNNIASSSVTGIMARMKVGFQNFMEQSKGMKGGIPNEIAQLFDRTVIPPSEAGIEGVIGSFKKNIRFNPERTFGNMLKNSTTRWFDRFDALNKSAEGGQNTESYIAARTAIASGDKAQLWFQTATYDFETQARNGESLSSIMKEAGNLKDISTYLTALNTVGRYEAGKPVILSVEDARKVITHYEGDPAMPALVERLKMYNTRLMEYAHKGGIISKATLKEFANQPFLPLEVLSRAVEGDLISRAELQDMIEATRNLPSGTEKEAAEAAITTAIKERNAAEEGTPKVDDPIMSLFASTVSIMRAVDVNRARAAIAKDWGLNAEPVEQNSKYGTVKGKSDRLKKISYSENGKAKSVYVQKDIYDAAKGLDADSQSMFHDITRFLTLPTRMLRAGAILDPGFIIRNLGRDQLTAGIQSNVGYKIGSDMLRGFGAILNHKTGGKMFSRFDEVYEKWVNAGGGSASQISGDRNILDKTLAELLSLKPVNMVKDPRRYLRGVLHLLNPLDKLRAVSESIEVSTRLGEFMRAREQGYTDRDAAFFSREVTLDFARAGTWGRVANAYAPFFNASLQGLNKEVRQLKTSPIKFGLQHLSYLVLPAFLASLAEQDMIRNSPNSQGAQKALETPEWEKAAFMHIYTGQDYKYQIKLPVLHGIKAMMQYSARKFVEFAYDQGETSWFMDYLKGMKLVAGNQTIDVLPPIIKVPYEATSNYNMFTGNRIVSAHLSNLIPELQYTPNTTLPARKVAKFMESVTSNLGLPIPEQLRSPVGIEHVVQGFTGTLGMNLLKTLDASMETNRPTRDWTELPVVRGFFTRYPSYSSASIERYNESAREIQRKYNSVVALAGRANEEDRMFMMQLVNSGMIVSVNNITSALSNISRMITGIHYNDMMTPDEKRQNIDNGIVQMIRTARLGNDYIKRIKELENASRQQSMP